MARDGALKHSASLIASTRPPWCWCPKYSGVWYSAAPCMSALVDEQIYRELLKPPVVSKLPRHLCSCLVTPCLTGHQR